MILAGQGTFRIATVLPRRGTAAFGSVGKPANFARFATWETLTRLDEAEAVGAEQSLPGPRRKLRVEVGAQLRESDGAAIGGYCSPASVVCPKGAGPSTAEKGRGSFRVA